MHNSLCIRIYIYIFTVHVHAHAHVTCHMQFVIMNTQPVNISGTCNMYIVLCSS